MSCVRNTIDHPSPFCYGFLYDPHFSSFATPSTTPAAPWLQWPNLHIHLMNGLLACWTATQQEKVRYNKKLEVGAKVMKELVAQYCKVVAVVKSARRAAGEQLCHAEVTFEELLAAEFPWLAETREGKTRT